MKKIFFQTLFLFGFIFISLSLFSQEEEELTRYYVFDYMKVEPGGEADYLALESVWKKIHEANIADEKYVGWEITRVISPGGYNVNHNYVTRTTYEGEDQLAASLEHYSFPANISEILTEEELKMVKNTETYRNWVKSEVWTNLDMVVKENLEFAKIQVFNYFKIPEGQPYNAHVTTEREIWKPVHASRVEAGEMEGWVLLRMVMPYGSGRKYSEATVDLYASLADHMSQGSGDHFVKVHPEEDFDELWERTKESSDLIWQEVRQYIDSAARK